MPTSDSDIQDRALGAFQGLAVGDALGATVEFMTRGEIKAKYGIHNRIVGGGWLRLRPGQVTDDTEMSLALGRAILRTNGFDAREACEEWAAWLRDRPIDVGATCRRGISRYMRHGTVWTPPADTDGGNGAAMRNLPVVLATLGNETLLGEWSLAQAHVTHNHPLSDAATLELARMTRALVLQGQRAPIQSMAQAFVARYPNFRYERPAADPSAYIVDTVRTVLNGFFATGTFQDCVVRVVNEGGDADTTGAIAGMLAGAMYGSAAIPPAWLRTLDGSVREEIRRQVVGLLRLSVGNRP